MTKVEQSIERARDVVALGENMKQLAIVRNDDEIMWTALGLKIKPKVPGTCVCRRFLRFVVDNKWEGRSVIHAKQARAMILAFVPKLEDEI